MSGSHSAVRKYSSYVGYYNGPNGNYWGLGVTYCFRNFGNCLPVGTAYRLTRHEFFRLHYILENGVEPQYLSRSSEQARGWTIRSLNPDRDKLFSLLHNRQERRWCPLHPTSCQLVPAFFRGGKAAWREFGHSPLSDAENGNERSCNFTFFYVFLSWTLTFIFASERKDILYLCIALMCAEYRSVEVLFSVMLRRSTGCLFLDLPKKIHLPRLKFNV